MAPPYVLVGHSAGGNIVRLFAAETPDAAAAVVLVDSSHPEHPPAAPDESRHRPGNAALAPHAAGPAAPGLRYSTTFGESGSPLTSGGGDDGGSGRAVRSAGSVRLPSRRVWNPRRGQRRSHARSLPPLQRKRLPSRRLPPPRLDGTGDHWRG
ncbi:alpha/beta fold hydrolase [Microbispora amethystogenes]|uniref:alpha/beta fold hydrolase n=1 Tax=Microbispora amethystogenes TaxID=1427754 RepID=UPI0023B2925A|nr:alpha/beta fold hydrolase [Microbispora amethystogenes]